MSMVEQNKGLYYATQMHDGVVYGGSMVMLDQIKEMASVIDEMSMLEPARKEAVLNAVYLHKSFEPKRMSDEWKAKRAKEGKPAELTDEEVASIGGTRALSIIKELRTEEALEKGSEEERAAILGKEKYAEYQGLVEAAAKAGKFKTPDAEKKEREWLVKSVWAKGLSKEAKEMMLAEKIINFETSEKVVSKLLNPRVSAEEKAKAKPVEWHKNYLRLRMMAVESVKDANPEMYKRAVRSKNNTNFRILVAENQNGGRE